MNEETRRLRLDDRDPGPQPVVFLCTILAWLCSFGVVVLIQWYGDNWWVLLPAIGLICLSFVVSLIVDVKQLNAWTRP